MKPKRVTQEHSHPLTTKQQKAIVALVQRQPGWTGREIATELQLDKRRVNGFLYSDGRQKYGLVARDWRWFAGSPNPMAPAAEPVNAQQAPEAVAEEAESLQSSLNTVHLSTAPYLRTVVSARSTAGICRVLLQIPEPRALRQISRMELETIDRICGEEDYPRLGETLQIALAERRACLMEQNEQGRLRRSTTVWSWMLRIAAVGVLGQLLWQLWRYTQAR